jgi:hypothetical protein
MAMLSRVLPAIDETPESEALERQRWIAAIRGSRERARLRAADASIDSDDLAAEFWMAA